MDEVFVQGLPESLRRYIVENCSIPTSSFQWMAGHELPEPARSLLDHDHDMTSTLSTYHGSDLYVDRIQGLEINAVYFREVFLRTSKSRKVVEYGVIGITLNSFSAEQKREIRADQTPFGGLLHKFEIDFNSSPVCFFAISAEYLSDTPFKDLKGHTFYGRFNQLTKTSGQNLAWIMEILPDDALL